MISIDLCLSASSFLLALYFYFKKHSPYASLPLPPGPKGRPIIGNLLDMPTEFEWEKYHEWSKKFDTDILHIPLMGTNLIVLDSAEAVVELMERRSSKYSDRPRMVMINELVCLHYVDMSTQVYSACVGAHSDEMVIPHGWYALWRKNRRVVHQFLRRDAAVHFHPHELKATHHLLERFLDSPDDVMGNLRHMAGETIISVAYGINIRPKDDPYLQVAEEGVHSLSNAAVPGTFLVDMLPVLKYVPEWMPGAGFQRKAKEWAKLSTAMTNVPFEASKKKIGTGKAPMSFVSLGLQKIHEETRDGVYQEDIIRGSAGSMYAGGSDTTLSVVASCILGLIENPAIVKRAQAELDSVIKSGHLPDFDDQDNLPYITALTMEALRWRVITPIAIPRCLQEDDEYKGYRLPKGSIVIPNSWAILHDESVYPDPFAFRPERFLSKDGKIDKSVRDPRHACFGFGRRICPGRHMAYSAVWVALTSLLYCFDIKKAVDENGNVIEPTHEYISALVVSPKPFKCSVTPRSLQHERAIRSAVLGHEFEYDI